MRDRVCGATLVRRSLNPRLALRQSDDTEIQERLISNTYGAGNLEALYIKGMWDIFQHLHLGALDAPLEDLDQAAGGAQGGGVHARYAHLASKSWPLRRHVG